MIKRIEKPDTSKISPKQVVGVLQNPELMRLATKSFAPYAPWEVVRHWPVPNGVRAEELWTVITMLRSAGRERSVIRNRHEKPFYWTRSLPGVEELLHHVDLNLGGNLQITGGYNDDERNRHRLLTRGIMEEAIASSQLEGANVTRKAAKRMIMEGRKPRTQSEQMILNNYNAMRKIEDDLKNGPMDETVLLALHKVLTTRTLDDESECGRFRRDDEEIVVGDRVGDEVYHVAPPEAFLHKEIKRFVAYANDELKDSGFVHPVVKAIFLHFWMGYLHPFTDGNGRVARALFYWYLLRKGYWAFGYLPLSTMIRRSMAQYRDAYLYSEQDNNDLTYFLDYNIRKLSQSMVEFDQYVQRKAVENSRHAKQARRFREFNDRQIQLLQYFNKDRDSTTSVTTYARIYEVARMTAIKDLKRLKELGYLVSQKVGRTVLYAPTEKVSKVFE